jgi:hypothetical protein
MRIEETEYVIYVPAAGFGIAAGAAVVGRPAADGVMLDFEGNLYGASGMETFEGRLQHAAGRATSRYPTVARMLVRPEQVVRVGTARRSEALGGWVVVSIVYPEAFAGWLGAEPLPPLHGSSGMRERAMSILASGAGMAHLMHDMARSGLTLFQAASARIEAAYREEAKAWALGELDVVVLARGPVEATDADGRTVDLAAGSRGTLVSVAGEKGIVEFAGEDGLGGVLADVPLSSLRRWEPGETASIQGSAPSP